MSLIVDPAIASAIVEEELARCVPLQATFGWTMEWDPQALRVEVGLRSAVDGEPYLLRAVCDNYKAWPPFLEFLEPDTRRAGTPRAYPRGGRGYFHSMPCVCAPFSRKAYTQCGGPHGDWQISNWMALRPEVTMLGEIFLLIQLLLNDPTAYQERMGQAMAQRAFKQALGSLGLLKPHPARVCVHETVVEATVRYLRESRGEEPHEGIVYWAGMTVERLVVVTTCLAPAAETAWGAYRTSAVANAKVIQAICDLGLQLLGQVHSHPGSFVRHSVGDDAGALMPYPGFYSLVVPFHAQEGMLPFSRCGIHRFDGRRFQRLSPEDVERLFQVIPACLDLRHA
jgi:hypothetical protein